MDTMDGMDIVHLDTVIATMMHMLDLCMDLVSDSRRMEMQKLLAVGVHNMVVDMEVVQPMALLVPESVLMDINLNDRLHDLIFHVNDLILRRLDPIWQMTDVLLFQTYGQVVGKKM